MSARKGDSMTNNPKSIKGIDEALYREARTNAITLGYKSIGAYINAALRSFNRKCLAKLKKPTS